MMPPPLVSFIHSAWGLMIHSAWSKWFILRGVNGSFCMDGFNGSVYMWFNGSFCMGLMVQSTWG